MDLHSLKGLLRNGKAAAAELSRALHALVTGLSQMAIEGSDEERARFGESILALANNIHEQTSGAEADATVSQTLELVLSYNERAAGHNKAKADELKTVMRTMTDTITFLSESRTRSVHQLRFMEREMEQATEIDDVRLLRARLMTCLEVVRNETARLQEESETRSTEVRQQVDRAIKISDQPTRFGSMDSVTGLPARRPAEIAIRSAVAQGDAHAVCVFVVERLAAINEKYGRMAGDEVMLRVANHLAQHLPATALLYRWSGPAFLSLATVKAGADDIKRAWAKAAGVKLEISLDAKGRSVFVMVDLATKCESVSKNSQVEEMFRGLDVFVGEHTDVPTTATFRDGR